MPTDRQKVQKRYQIIIGVLLCVLWGIIALTTIEWGVPASRLTHDLHTQSKIPEDWIIEGDVSDQLAAYICYPEGYPERSRRVIYVNRPGLSFGYLFRHSESLSGIDEYVTAYTLEDLGETAFLSMNYPQVAKIEINNGKETQVIDIDSQKPFAIVIPEDSGFVQLYDVNGNSVPYYRHTL